MDMFLVAHLVLFSHVMQVMIEMTEGGVQIIALNVLELHHWCNKHMLAAGRSLSLTHTRPC